MSDLLRQTSDVIAGDPNREANVIHRGRISLITSTQGPSSIYAPYYYAEHTIDLSFLNTAGLFPSVEVWRFTGTAGSRTFVKAPYSLVDAGSLNVGEYVKVQVNENIVKSGGYTLGLTIGLFNKTQNITREFYFTVLGTSIGATDTSLFPDLGTFSA